ncbi:MAG: dihydrodipicolinate synthase family protein [Candidatus Hydrogenedentes bacterium]|nr:dihydrodipicolinate synthase family protein [Candidatus Hydrogenedentota bacterium]
MKFKVEGIISAMVTPFTTGGEFVDFDKVAPLAAHLEKKGAGGLFPCGTTGEGLLCSTEERKTILEEVVGAVTKKCRVIAHTGAFDTATTVELTRHAQKAGAAAAAVVAPGFYGYDARALQAFYETVADAVPGFPVLLYNIPSCAKNELSADLIKTLASSRENIVGIKDSSGSMTFLTRLFNECPKDFAIINGADEHGFQAILAGCKAVVSGSSNAYIDIYVDIYNQIKKGNLKKAWQSQLKLEKACRLFTYGGGLAGLKHIMKFRTLDAGFVRPPQRELDNAEKKRIETGLSEQGLI